MNIDKKLEQFCDYLLSEGLEKITIEGYRGTLSRFLKEVGTEKPKKKQAKDYILKMLKCNYSYSHYRNTMTVIERYMKFIKKPVEFKRPRKPQELPAKDILTEGEIARMLAACKNVREKAMVALLAYCGLRSKEICQLNVKDIDLNTGMVKVKGAKFNKDRIVPLSEECNRALRQYLIEYSKRENVFTTLIEDKQYNGWSLRKMVKKIAKNANIEKRVYPHLLRHTFCSHLLEKGANVIAVQQFMGHNNIQTTMRYTHFSPKRLYQEYHYYMPNYI